MFGPIVNGIKALLHNQIRTTYENLDSDRELKRRWKMQMPENPSVINASLLQKVPPLSLTIDTANHSRWWTSGRPYFINEIEKDFPQISVRKLPDSRTDVVRGLARLALDRNIISQKRCTRSYGLITQYEHTDSKAKFEKLEGTVEPHTKTMWKPVSEWSIRKVSFE